MRLSSALTGAGGAGQRLPEAVQRKMEAFFKADFSDVRVHVGPQASAIGALAFTQGRNLYFAPGQYDPQSPRGQQLLGHELAHVIQQRAGRVRNPFGADVAIVFDRSLEAEADALGLRAAMHQMPVQAKMAASAALPHGSSGVAQCHQHATAMRNRRRFKRSLKTAISRIRALGVLGPATAAQINIHDEVQHAGQHHGFRNVTVSQLIKDIQATIDNQTQMNLVDSDNP
jgi:hypothetical protein